MLLIVTYCNVVFMGVIRIDDDLQKQIQEWIKINGNKFTHSSAASFVNKAIFEKLNKLK